MTEYPFYHSQAGYEIIQSAYDDALANWQIAPESVMIDTSVGETHVLIAGDRSKPPLIFFHGWNANAGGVHGDLDVPRLTKHFCLYCPDTPGQTGRSVAIRPDTKGTAFAEWGRDLLDGLNLDKAYLVGVSGGGFIAHKVAAHLGERIIGVFGIAPYSIALHSNPPLKFLMIAIPTVITKNKRLMRNFVSRLAPHGRTESQIEDMRVFMHNMNAHFTPAWNPAPLSDDELRAIQCPVYQVYGKHDITMNIDSAMERAKRLLPNVKIVLFEDEGHIFSPDGIKIVVEKLLTFFNP